MQPSPSPERRDERGRVLLALARSAIEQELGRGGRIVAAADEAWLREPGATFVTLQRDDELRGCVGTLRAHRPLLDDVRANAVAAAFHDNRFPPLAASELPRLQVEVSLVSPLEPVRAASEQELVAMLQPEVDGVLVELDGYRATFLPQVWESLPRPEAFLRALKHKAGLPEGFWSPDLRVWRYTVEKFSEM